MTSSDRSRKRRLRLFSAGWVVLTLGLFNTAGAHEEVPAQDGPPRIAFDQNLNAPAPLDLVFRDEHGRTVRLGDYFGSQPVILVPVYYACPRICPLVLEGVVRSLRTLSFSVGKELRVVAFSIDPKEGPDDALDKKRIIAKRYDRAVSGEGWHFLTGDVSSIEPLARAIGFRYSPQSGSEEYAHASGIVIVTPDGRIARYFYGFDFAPRDLKFGLMEAAEGRIGSVIDQLLLLCYKYDPTTGKYGLVIQRTLRLSGLATVLALGTFMFVMFRRERRNGGRRKVNP